ETLAARRRERRVPQNLYRRNRSDVSSFGEVDDAHTAFAEPAHDPVWSEGTRRRSVAVLQHVGREGVESAVEDEIRASVFVQEHFHVSSERRIVSGIPKQELVALGIREVDCLVKEGL